MDFRKALASNKWLFFDGGMGSLLQARGLPAGVSPEQFCLERRDILEGIYRDYANAGADVLTTNTFGGSFYKLGSELNVREFNKIMAQAARKAADEASQRLGRPIYVAGSIGPCGHFVQPLGDLSPHEYMQACKEQVLGLLEGGVDCFLAETQIDLAEARLIVATVKQTTDLPVAASMTFENGVSLTGSTPEIFVETMNNMGVDFVATNCSAGPEQMVGIIQSLAKHARMPVLAEPNAGLPELVNGETCFRLDPQSFAKQASVLAAHGARLLGGCCGTTPEHIAQLRKAVEAMGEPQVVEQNIARGVVLSSRSTLLNISDVAPFCVIGERINPTGKKELSAQFQAGELSLALQYADEQIATGVPILDLNVGAPMVDEVELLPRLVQQLVAKMSTPLALDSSNADAIIAALPYYPGSVLVNSISGEPGRMEQLGPYCRDFGAPFILLPIQGRKLPVKSSERIAIIEQLLIQADSLGIPRHLIVIDVLALAVSSKAEAARYCLETIRWCAQNNLPTTIGLSNVSFGLPAREIINATFLAMAAGAGLTSCIGNLANSRMADTVAGVNVLSALDPNAGRFIETYANWQAGTSQTVTTVQSAKNIATCVKTAVILGDLDNIIKFVDEELANGTKPFVLVQEKLIPGITEVGSKYERREYFLPQLIRAAETMQRAFQHIQPLLEEEKGSEKKPVVILATVEGDIHDIGKNIVALLLGNHGFEVIDLGKDVKAETIITEATNHDAQLIGLSALMTTTMVRMEDTIKLVKEAGLAYKVFIGGAVVTQAYADAIGADGYAADAVEAVRVANQLLAKK